MKTAVLIFSFVILIVSPVFAEDVKITTYYPSPSGSYKNLQILNTDTSAYSTDFVATLNQPGISLVHTYRPNASYYAPGIFWSADNNNSGKPRAGIWYYEDGVNANINYRGSHLLFGVSDNFSQGITRAPLRIVPSGGVYISKDDYYPDAIADGYALSVVSQKGFTINALSWDRPTGDPNPSSIGISAYGRDYGIMATASAGRPEHRGYAVYANSNKVGIFSTADDTAIEADATRNTTSIGLKATGIQYGIKGRTSSTPSDAPIPNYSDPNGAGVYGFTNIANGVVGEAQLTGVGVRGISRRGIGVYGQGGVETPTAPGVFDFYAQPGGAPDYNWPSSIRWKDNVATLQNPLQLIEKLRGVTYDWKKEYGGRRDMGLIAEEVGKVLPDMVSYDKNGKDAIGMDYSRFIPVLVESVKAQQKEIEELKAEIKALKSEAKSSKDEFSRSANHPNSE